MTWLDYLLWDWLVRIPGGMRADLRIQSLLITMISSASLSGCLFVTIDSPTWRGCLLEHSSQSSHAFSSNSLKLNPNWKWSLILSLFKYTLTWVMSSTILQSFCFSAKCIIFLLQRPHICKTNTSGLAHRDMLLRHTSTHNINTILAHMSSHAR